MNICYGCLKSEVKLQNHYCKKCIKEVFDNVVPNRLSFDKTGFIQAQIELSPKMSISGVQDKLSLQFNKKDLVPTASNGKYILKPIPLTDHIKNKKDLVANEHLSMLISKNIFKIKTASCVLIEFSDKELAYLTKRFDYDRNSDNKYDQEDFASLLEASSYTHGADYKYSAKTYIDCANIIKKYVATSMITLEDFFKRIILNYLISNGDAHLKNFSLYSNPNKKEYLLSPNYDLLNTRYHVNEKFGDLAVNLFDGFTKTYEAVGFYTYADFKEFSRLIGLPEVRFNKIIDFANSTLPLVHELVLKSFLSEEAKEYYIQSYNDRLKRLNYKL